MKNYFVLYIGLGLSCIAFVYTTSILAELPEEMQCRSPAEIENGLVKVFHKSEEVTNSFNGKELSSKESNFLPRKRFLVPAKDQHMHPSGSVAEYSCNRGFWIHPPTDVRHTCHHGEWVGKIPYCASKGCQQPKRLMNGYHIELAESSNNLYPPGSRIQFLCHAGYLLKGPDVLICDETGSWNPDSTPLCLPSPQILNSKRCLLPPDVFGSAQKLIEGAVGGGGAVQGTIIEYRCRAGYRNLVAPCVAHPLTCRGGEWHGSPPQCKEFSSCLPPPSIPNGYMYEVASSYQFQSQVYYSCERGYRLMGPFVLICEDTGCWTPNMPPVCQLNHMYSEEPKETALNIHTLLVAAISGIIAVMFLLLALLLYHRAVSPKLVRLRSSGSELEPRIGQPCPPINGLTQTDHDPLIAYPDDLLSVTPGVPPTYEEAVRQRPALPFDPQTGRYTPHAHRSRGHRVVAGVRRTRHRDNPDNISYQSIGSARQSSGTSRSMSVRSWSACDSLGSTDTVAISDSTNITVETMSSGAVSGASQTPSCRGLAGSRASFDSSSLMNNEGAPLLEEAEGEEVRAEDEFSLCTRDSDSMKDNVSHTRSVTVSLQE